MLFSADGFGKFGMQVQNLLKKAAALDIRIICPLHGPLLTENLEYYVNLYQTWSSYGVESEGIMIAYTSVYGHTKAAAELLAKNTVQIRSALTEENEAQIEALAEELMSK